MTIITFSKKEIKENIKNRAVTLIVFNGILLMGSQYIIITSYLQNNISLNQAITNSAVSVAILFLITIFTFVFTKGAWKFIIDNFGNA